MHQIVYTSTATEDFSTTDLRKLLLGARTRNRALGVSGMLVFHGGTFLQALEGEQRAVLCPGRNGVGKAVRGLSASSDAQDVARAICRAPSAT